MNKFYSGLLLVITLVFNTSVSLSGDVTQDVGADNPIYRIRDSVLSYFQPVRGIVLDVEDGFVRVSLKTDRAFKKGVRFFVFREGSPFYHPVTKKLIGKTEDLIGRIEIKQKGIGERIYLCEIIKGNIKPGDIIRITSSRIKLAFFQDRKSDWTLSEMFYRSLKSLGRFEILESYTTSYEINKLSNLAKELGAEAVLMFSTPTEDEKKFLNVKLFWSEDAKVFADLREVVETDLAREFTSGEEFLSIRTTEIEPWASYELASGELMAIGDVDGNGIRELVVSDGNNIRIYSLKDEPQEIWFIKGNPQEKHLSIDVLDLNDNGRAEIFVTSLIDVNIDTDLADNETHRKINHNKMSSFVMEYNSSEGYRKIWDNAPYFLRVIGNTLLMQKFDRSEIFGGPVYEGGWKDGHYQPSRPLRLPPENINIYGFTFVDWKEKGHAQIITFDDDGYLNLYNNGQLIWRSRDTYGKFNISFKRETYSMVNYIKEWSVRGRLISVKTNRGQKVIVVKKVPVLSRVPGLGMQGAEVYSLSWEGGMMDEELILRGISGTVTDYWVEGKKLFLIARSGLFTFVKKAISGEFSRGSVLYYYNFAEK